MKNITLKNLLPALLLGIILIPAAQSDEYDGYRKCLARAGAEDLEAKIEFQNQLAELIADETPGLGALALLNRDLQIAMAKSRHIKLDYLIENDLTRLVSASGLTRFNNFDWQREDEALLQAVNEDYVALLAQIKTLGEENNDHPAWPELRARFIDLQNGKAFGEIMEDFEKAREKAAERLEKC